MSEKVEQSVENSQETMVKGMAWLTAGNIISRLIGVIYIIPWYMWLGSEHAAQANALYNMGYQIYANFLLISTAGLPTAVAKQVAKYNVLGREDISYHLVRQFFKLMLVMGFVFALSMYLLSPTLAALSGSKEELTPVMYSLVPPLLVFPVMSTMRGFFQGRHNLKPYAISQIVEQIVRVIWILACTYYIMKLGSGNYLEAVVQSTFAAFVSMLASVALLVYVLYKEGHLSKIFQQTAPSVPISTKDIIMETVREAIPIILLGLAIQLFQFIDQVTFVNFLQSVTDLSHSDLLVQYSYMVSNPSKITMLVIGISLSIASVAVPMVTERFIQGKKKETARLVVSNLRMVFLLTIPTIVGMLVLAKPLYTIFYGPSETSAIALFRLNLLTILPLGLYSVLSVTNQALFESRRAIFYLVCGLTVKIGLQFPLLYFFQAYGALYATIIGMGLTIFLLYRRIVTVLSLKSRLVYQDVFKVTVLSLVMGGVVGLAEWVLTGLLPATGYISSAVHIGISGLLGLVVFALLTLRTRHIDQLIGQRADQLRRFFHIR